ncbi:MAG: cytochrome bd-I oxidase subunit CydX [Gammaproteobacteria bacterium]
MWYFSWILGLLLACSLGIINVLRLEAQEALAKEHIPLDPLTQLLTKEAILVRLREKIENSKRNGLPFSLVFLSLTDFKNKHQLPDHEMDTTLRNVVDCFKSEVRQGLDIVSRFGELDFLIAFPGASLHTADNIAARFRENIRKTVKTPSSLPVEIAVGVAEYSVHAVDFGEEVITTSDEVDELVKMAASHSSSAVRA